jgi:hypothetical protein
MGTVLGNFSETWLPTEPINHPLSAKRPCHQELLRNMAVTRQVAILTFASSQDDCQEKERHHFQIWQPGGYRCAEQFPQYDLRKNRRNNDHN